jgi:hypothetical protein
VKVPLEDVFERVGAFLMGQSPIHETARRLARALDELHVPFVVVGAMAVNAHGHLRTTGDVDVLLTREGLEAFKRQWLDRGWVEKFPGSKGLRDAVTNVPVDVLLAGEFPGDGAPKPVVFPDPARAEVERSPSGFPVLALRPLLELKLASGMTAPHRPRDLDDAIQLIRRNGLPRDYAGQLDPWVREKFLELWQAAQVDEDS